MVGKTSSARFPPKCTILPMRFPCISHTTTMTTPSDARFSPIPGLGVNSEEVQVRHFCIVNSHCISKRERIVSSKNSWRSDHVLFFVLALSESSRCCGILWYPFVDRTPAFFVNTSCSAVKSNWFSYLLQLPFVHFCALAMHFVTFVGRLALPYASN